ncbi:MAG TPA: peptidoglycan editing factor PgeF [Hyphomonadaceae bacterium]|nr:peptidoglycan editing factor PgeF [Hyphomonadaceae bacterium]
MPVESRSAPPSRILSAASPPHWNAAALARMRHAFFGREGGVSTGIYASLNAGTGSRDDPKAVAENRARIASALGVAPSRLIGVHQVHSPDAVFVAAPWEGERPHADALVTTTPGLALSILTADCAPVLFADAEAGVIGAAHAGWKGALAGVLENCVALMRKHGARDIAAAIGPCIHQASYEVGPEFVERFVQADRKYARFFASGAGEKSRFDLPGFCAMRLEKMGIAAEISPLNTYARAAQLHSHRRSVHEELGDYGRNCSVIAL